MCDPVSIVAVGVGALGATALSKGGSKPAQPAPAPDPIQARETAAQQAEAERLKAANTSTDRANQLLRAEAIRKRAQRSLLGSFDTAGTAAAPATVGVGTNVLGGGSIYAGSVRVPRMPAQSVSA